MSDVEHKRPVVLEPFAAHARYFEDLSVRMPDNSFAVRPGVIGTVYFAGGSKPEGRRGLLACFDRFAELFGEPSFNGQWVEVGIKTAEGFNGGVEGESFGFGPGENGDDVGVGIVLAESDDVALVCE